MAIEPLLMAVRHCQGFAIGIQRCKKADAPKAIAASWVLQQLPKSHDSRMEDCRKCKRVSNSVELHLSLGETEKLASHP